MSFGAASWLLVLILPAAGAAWRWRRRVPAEAAPKLARVLISGRSVRAISESPRAGGWRLLVALVLTILALARPRWGGLERAAEEPAREIVIALDLSRSMRVPDMAPSRLARAHRLVGQLLDGLQGERVALVVFAGTGFVQVPLTSDYQIMREFLPALEPGYLPQGGSDYGAMLRAAEEAFSTDPRVDRYLFVLSDGGSTTDDWRGALPGLAERGVTMVSIGFGTEAGGDVPPLENEQSPARSRLERAPLQMLAHATGGIYRDAIDLDARQLLAETVEARIGWQRASAGGAEPRERYGWFLAPAIVFAALGLWREVPVRPRQRAIARRPGAPSWLVLATAAAAILCVAAVLAHEGGHEYPEEVTAAGKLQWLVEDLAQHPELSAADLALLAERTINYALETLARGERVPEGPVRDALGAIACGEKMDPAAADWATLRSVLERSLARENAAATERPPEQKKAARDEEDRPTQTNGQGAQQATSESMGQGGVAKTDAALGELRREPAARRPAGPPRPGAARAGAGRADAGGTVGTRDPLRALTLKRFKEVAKGDTPGVLFQALMGEAAAAAGGRDW